MFIIEYLNAEDEQLNGSPSFRIRDKDGNIVYDNCTIEQITEVLKNGTEMNKPLFDKIDKNFERINYFHKTGEDVYKFIMDGEYQGRVDGVIRGTERARMKRIDDLEAEIKSLKTRVSKLEG